MHENLECIFVQNVQQYIKKHEARFIVKIIFTVNVMKILNVCHVNR